MKCLECGAECERLDNAHLMACSGFTLQEYAIRHQLPLELILHADQVNQADSPADYPPAQAVRSENARSTLAGIRWSGLLETGREFVDIPGDIRRLDLLLWDLDQLADYGFRFRQDYEYGADTHRVVARNRLRTPLANLRAGRGWVSPEPPPDFLDTLAVYVAHSAELQAGYLFMPFAESAYAEEVRETLSQDHQVGCVRLDVADRVDGTLLRTHRLADTTALFALLSDRLKAMPGAWERFHADTPTATVSKELVFDAAHFITDHPAKCSNQHGGRYQLHVEVSGRIDPVTGCVVDYGYLKRVVNRLVIERFDHHHLNYAAAELAWRSSTEMLCVHIWESLIDYLPGLSGLRLFETTQSWCDYRGPSLEEHQLCGPAPLLRPFTEPTVPELRRRYLSAGSATLPVVADGTFN